MGLGTWEIALIFLVVLLVFGAKRIPEIARGLGKGIREFKDATNDIKREINVGDTPPPPSQIQPPPQTYAPPQAYPQQPAYPQQAPAAPPVQPQPEPQTPATPPAGTPPPPAPPPEGQPPA